TLATPAIDTLSLHDALPIFVRNLLQSIFLRHKLPVTLANNLAEAQAHLAREPFDLMMLDLRLPDGDGLKFLEQVNTLPVRPLVRSEEHTSELQSRRDLVCRL